MKKEKSIKKLLTSLLVLLCVMALSFGAIDLFVPRRVSASAYGELSLPCIEYGEAESVFENSYVNCFSVPAELFGIIRLKKTEVVKRRELSLIPGGEVFGVRMMMSGVLVVGTSEVEVGGRLMTPAVDAGIREKDLILKVGTKRVTTAAELSALVEASGGCPLTMLIKRGNEEISVTLTPVRADGDGKYRSGLLVKDTSAGIGTVTFIDPETGTFGALGHGICDRESGALIPITRGTVTNAVIRGVEKGSAGDPGEIRGYLGAVKKGTLLENTATGVYGVLLDVDASRATVPVGYSDTVHTGAATIRSTLDGEGVKEYDIEITEIHKKSETKCFSIRVIDKELLAKTGGIIQGMSGSPIIQDGKLIGAVTHVLVSDPTAGYGIFIENMLSAAQIPMAKAS